MTVLLLLVILVVLMAVISRSNSGDDSYDRGFRDGYRYAQEGNVLPTDIAGAVGSQQTTPPAAAQPAASVNELQTLEQLNHFGDTSTQSPMLESIDTATIEEAKRESRLQTINVTLYVASLLLVGGIALFTTTVFGGGVLPQLLFGWLAVAVYYGIGLWLHETSSQLRPVSIAFVGTALAGAPFVGLLHHTLLDVSLPTTWFATSLICLVAYGYAAIQLRSPILGYALGVVLVSMALSSVSLMGLAVVWFFVAVLLLAAVLSFARRMLGEHSTFGYIVEPLTTVGKVLPPLTLLASLIVSGSLSWWDLTLIWTIVGVYYVSQALYMGLEGELRSNNWAVARMILSIAAVIGVYAAFKRVDYAVVALGIVGLLQSAASVLVMPVRQKIVDQHEILTWFGLGTILASPLFLAMYTGPVFIDKSALVASILGVAAVASFAVALRLKRSEFGYLATIAAFFWPVIFADSVNRERPELMLATYVGLVAALVVGRVLLLWKAGSEARVYTIATMAALTLPSIALGLSSEPEWQAGLLAILAALYYLVSWIDTKTAPVLLGNLLLVFVIEALADAAGFELQESIALLAAFATTLFAGMYVLMRYESAPKTDMYQNAFYLTALASGIFFGGISLATDGVYGGIAMLGLLIAGVLVYVERWRLDIRVARPLAVIIITLALQRMLGVTPIDVHTLVYSHWWAITFAVLGYKAYRGGDKEASQAYAYIALAIVTLFGAFYALNGGNVGYRLLFLVEHSALVIAGLVLSWRLLTWWGAVGITLAILYMFRGYTSLFLTLIGLVIILAVIWVVRREGKGNRPE